ncbi:hypothetical protein AQPW35_25220 [Rubrivivax pictus]|uniref:POTRA domain-containing protein n=1 Tax=Pseudaquabacterium pictum TaxID=2315236 RepID=A0A480APT1_9BURK|nr:hypothetical protein AQPW35_25220 [Rubrivivax pictus]
MLAGGLAAAPALAQPAAATPADQRPGGLLPNPADLAPRAPLATDARDLPARPAPPRELQKPSGDLTLDVRGFRLSPNAPPELLAAAAELLAPYTGPQRSYEDLVNATADVTRFLQRESGWYLGYAYLPEQVPEGGIVQIQLLEGRLDRIDLQWPESLPVQRRVIEGYLAQLRPGEILRVRDVERVVFLINDLRGITARFDIVAGSQPGTASLRVTGQQEDRWSGKADADVNGSRFLGTGRLGVLVAANSLAGLGDAFTASVLASTTGGLGFGLLSYALPVGSSGLKLGASLSAVRYQLDSAAFNGLDIHGDGLTLNAYALYPWVRSRNLNLFAVASVDHKRYDDSTGGIARQRQVNNLSLGLTGDLRDDWFGGAVSTFEAHVASGDVRYDGGRPDSLDDAPRFTKLSVGVNRLQNLVDGRLLLYAALRGQWAFDNLDSGEQFRVGGPDGVRAFAPGEGTGDSGMVVSAELRLLPPEDWLGRLARETVFSVFVDHGELRFRQDASAQGARFVNTARYSGAGVSVAWERPRTYTLRVSLAGRVAGEARSDKRVRNPRLYAQFTYFF